MTRTLEEITEALEPEAVRNALKQKLTQVNAMLTEAVIDRQVEEVNPTLEGEVKKAVLKQLAERIINLDQIRGDIQKRLDSSDEALRTFRELIPKPNRAARRRNKNGVKEGV